jgi:hypothetical protein
MAATKRQAQLLRQTVFISELDVVMTLKNQNHNTETKFMESIDARFPYNNPKTAKALAVRALKISPNAVFAVYEELARKPRSIRTSRTKRLAVLEYIEERFVHPLSGLASWLARKGIIGELISPARAAVAARIISKFPGCYCALNLAYFSCDDKREENERLFDSIRQEWAQYPQTMLEVHGDKLR